MSNQRQFPQREKNILDNTNLSISAPCPTAEGKWSNLNFLVINGNPRIMIYTNDPNDAGNDHGRIVVQMTPLVFESFLTAWENCLSQPPGYKEIIECENFTFFGGKRSERPELLHKIIVGNDGDGVVSIMVLDVMKENRPRIKFEVKAPRFIKFVGQDGTPFPKDAESKRFSKVWLNLLRPLVAKLTAETWKEPKPRNQGQNQGGQRQGGYQQQQPQQQQQNASNYDDDLPF